MTHISLKRKKKEKKQHYVLQIHIFSKTSFPPFICHFSQTTQINRNLLSLPVNVTTCCTPSATMPVFLFEFTFVIEPASVLL